MEEHQQPGAEQQALVLADDVLEEASEITSRPVVHVLYRADEGYRLSGKRLRKTVPEDLHEATLAEMTRQWEARLRRDLKFLARLRKLHAALRAGDRT